MSFFDMLLAKSLSGGGGGGDAEATLKALCDGSIVNFSFPSGVTHVRDSITTGCDGLVSVVIPEGVATIGNTVVYNSANIKTVELPSTLTSIGNYFCGGAQSVMQTAKKVNVTIHATTPPTLGASPFYNRVSSGAMGKIYVPSESVSAYKSESGWSTFVGYIQAIPE